MLWYRCSFSLLLTEQESNISSPLILILQLITVIEINCNIYLSNGDALSFTVSVIVPKKCKNPLSKNLVWIFNAFIDQCNYGSFKERVYAKSVLLLNLQEVLFWFDCSSSDAPLSRASLLERLTANVSWRVL